MRLLLLVEGHGEQFPRVHNLCALSLLREVLLVAGNQVVRACGFSTLQEAIVRLVWRGSNRGLRDDRERLEAKIFKELIEAGRWRAKGGPAQDKFVLAEQSFGDADGESPGEGYSASLP